MLEACSQLVTLVRQVQRDLLAFPLDAECVGKPEILVEQQPLQGVLVCDHAGLIINTLSTVKVSGVPGRTERARRAASWSHWCARFSATCSQKRGVKGVGIGVGGGGAASSPGDSPLLETAPPGVSG